MTAKTHSLSGATTGCGRTGMVSSDAGGVVLIFDNGNGRYVFHIAEKPTCRQCAGLHGLSLLGNQNARKAAADVP